jgi:RteC protein
METFIQELYEKLESSLSTIEQQTINKLELAQQAIGMTRVYLELLRKFIIENGFPNSNNEIEFFKNIKPKFNAKLIFYLRIYYLETRRPAASISLQKKLLRRELKRIQYFLHQNSDFFSLLNSGSTLLDEKYFVRGNHDPNLAQDEYFLTIDPEFCTIHSYKISKKLAYESLQVYLYEELQKLEGITPVSPLSKHTLEWQASKTDLIELLYSLYSARVLGKTELKKIVIFFQTSLHIDLGNYPRVFQQIRIRKKNRTVFLDHLKEELIRHMDEVDENFR